MSASSAPAGPTRAFTPWARSPRFRSSARSSPMRWCGRSMRGFPPTSGCCRRTRSPQSSTRATTPGTKTYRYRICNADVLSPFERHYAWHVVGAAGRGRDGRGGAIARGAARLRGVCRRRRDHTHDRTDGHAIAGQSNDEPLRHRERSTTEDTEDTEEQTGSLPPRPPCPPWWRFDSWWRSHRLRNHRRRVSPPHGPGHRRHAGGNRARATVDRADARRAGFARPGTCRSDGAGLAGCSSSASSIGTYNERHVA